MNDTNHEVRIVQSPLLHIPNSLGSKIFPEFFSPSNVPLSSKETMFHPHISTGRLLFYNF